MSAATQQSRPSPHSNASNVDYNGEVSHDMHLKMSKKIAQLTKVIYALNTKNDENELVVENLKKEHATEIEKLLQTNRDKLSRYQSAIGQDTEYRKQIRSLESCISDYENQNNKLVSNFEEYKNAIEAKEAEMTEKYLNKVNSLNDELSNLRNSYQQVFNKVASYKDEIDKAKKLIAQEEKVSYDKKLEEVMKNHQEMEESLGGAAQKVHEKYLQEIDLLKFKLQTADTELTKTTTDYEEKLKKFQLFHEKEINVLKLELESGKNEELTKLQKSYDDLKKEYYAAQSDNKKQKNDLLLKLTNAEDMIEKLKSDLQHFDSSDSAKDVEIKRLTSELQMLKVELDECQKQLHTYRMEMQTLEDKCSQQLSDIMKKTELIGELQATIVQHESMIKDLKEQLMDTKSQVVVLEQEKTTLLRENESKSSSSDHRIEKLIKELEFSKNEKLKIEQKMESELQKLTSVCDEKEKVLVKKHENEKKLSAKKHSDEMNTIEKNHTEVVSLLNQENNSKLELMKTQNDKERKDFEKELSAMRKENESQIKKLKHRAVELENALREKESGLGSVSETLEKLNSEKARLQSETDEMTKKLKVDQNELNRVRSEYERLKVLHDQKLKDAKKEMSRKLSELSAELDKKWAETMRRENAKLRQEYEMQNKADSQAGLQAFKKLKDQELTDLKNSFEQEKIRLKEEIVSLKENLRIAESNSLSYVETAKEKYDRDLSELRNQITYLEKDKINAVKEAQKQCKKELIETQTNLNRQILDIEAGHTRREQDALKKAELIARTEIEKVRLECEQKKQKDLDEMLNRMEHEKEAVRSELVARFAAELDGHTGSHSQQLVALERSLQEVREESELRERNLSQRMELLRVENGEKEKKLAILVEKMESLKYENGGLQRDVDHKEREIMQVRSEGNSTMKKREDEISIRYEAQLMKVKEESDKERRRIIEEFSKAQELLKMKILEYRSRVEESDAKFKNREPREEDVREIESLKIQVRDRENEIKRLVEDMKFYKNELINRETNYNKVFNGSGPSSPQIGVINPLAKKKKPGSGSSLSDYKASGGKVSHPRLVPLPGSPLHDESLSQSKPLPPPHALQSASKKFL